MRRIIIPVLIIIILLAGCGNPDDFRGTSWGMTRGEVISIEAENGNVLDEESGRGDTIIEYEDIMVNGVKADLEYVFKNSVMKTDALPLASFHDDFREYTEIVYNHEMDDEEKTERLNKINEKNKEVIEEYDNLPDTFRLTDYLLVEARYTFQGIEDGDNERLFNSLVDRYGEPIGMGGPNVYSEDTIFYLWFTDRVTVALSGWDIRYYANVKALEEWLLINNDGKAGNDL